MLYYDRIDKREGIDLDKSNNSKEWIICHCCFFNHRYKFQDSVCNCCHDLAMLNVNMSDIAISTIKNLDYLWIIHNISRSESVDLLKSSVLQGHGYIQKILS